MLKHLVKNPAFHASVVFLSTTIVFFSIYYSNGDSNTFHFDPESTPGSSYKTPCTCFIIYCTVIPILKHLIKEDEIKDQEAKKKIRSMGENYVHNAGFFSTFHSTNLFLLSLYMLVMVVLGAIQRFNEDGNNLLNLICTRRSTDTMWDGKIGFVTYIFYLSKGYELFDTVLLAVKGKPIIFLHFFHHSSMLFATWSWFAYHWFEGAWWCTFVNSFIHSFMYYYYLHTLVLPNKRVWWKKHLTTAQIVQFMTGNLFVGTYWYYTFYTDAGCTSDWRVSVFNILVNCTFVILFYDFSKKTYGGGHKKQG